LRYRTPDSELRVKMWLFPVLSILTAVAILAILVQMYLQDDLRSQLVLSLLSWAVVLVLYFGNRWYLNRRPEKQAVAAGEKAHRVLVMANETVNSHELLDELRSIGADKDATYYVVVPTSPIETGVAATHGPLDVWEATQQAAQARLDLTLAALRSENLEAEGTLGDQRPLRALAEAVDAFDPDQIVIATLPPEYSIWHRYEVVDRARAEHHVPVTHVVATPVGTANIS
jgi:GABA permease